MTLSDEKNGETVRQHLLEIINVLKVLTFQGTCETRVTSQATLKLLGTAHCPCLSPGRHCRTTPMCQRRPASMSHQNSTPVQLCATCLCLPKSKAKEYWHCQKILPRLLKTIWQRKDVWKTLFQNKS